MTAIELLTSGHPHQALPILRKKAKREPNLENLLALSGALRGCAQFQEAMDVLKQCLFLSKGQSVEAYNNIAQNLTDIGDFQGATEIFRMALQKGEELKIPTEPMQQILLGMAHCLMRLGQFEFSWQAWEAARLGMSWSPLPMTKPWAGESKSRVIVVCEGGFGDAFLFSRWLPKVKEVSDRVGLLIWDSLIDWCDWKRFGVDEILPLKKSIRASEWDYTTSWMSLPGIFGMKSLDDVPRDLAFDAFMATIPSHEKLTLRVTGNTPRIGFCWRAEENGVVRKIRSLDDHTANAVAKELAKTGSVYSLCPQGKSLHRHEQFKVPARVIQKEESLAGWRETTKFILTMDLVVTVDTAVAHLAGLCGVPTLLLLPLRVDWKWGLNREKDPWYGSHVRYYRETRAEGWQADQIVIALNHRLAGIRLDSELRSNALKTQ
jgi:hypothetical protein